MSPPPPPLPLYLPPIGQWQQPQAEHSGEPLGDPSARVFDVFLMVSQSPLLGYVPLGLYYYGHQTMSGNIVQWEGSWLGFNHWSITRI